VPSALIRGVGAIVVMAAFPQLLKVDRLGGQRRD
jgi:hypothetical protein